MYTVPDLLIRHRGTAASERVAIVDGPRRVTYGDLLERSAREALPREDLRRGVDDALAGLLLLLCTAEACSNECHR